RVAFAAALVVALVVPLAALGTLRSGSDPPTFERDVAPILQSKCEGCHRLGGIAPFAFATRKDVTTWARAIGTTGRSGVAPPWPPGPSSPHYVGEETRKLSDAERTTILSWVQAGAHVDGPP